MVPTQFIPVACVGPGTRDGARVVNVVVGIGARLLKTKGLRAFPVSCMNSCFCTAQSVVAHNSVQIYLHQRYIDRVPAWVLVQNALRVARQVPSTRTMGIPPCCRWLWTGKTEARSVCTAVWMAVPSPNFLHASISAAPAGFFLRCASCGDDICRCLTRVLLRDSGSYQK